MIYVPWDSRALIIFDSFIRRAIHECMWPAILVFAMIVTPGLVVKVLKYFAGKIG